MLAVVVCLALGVAGYWFKNHRAMANSKKGEKPSLPAKMLDAPPVAVMRLDSFTVNLADPDHSTFLRVGISLGLNKALPAASDPADGSPFIPEVRDSALSVLTTWQSSQLLAPDGKTMLKKQLLRVLQQRVPQLGIVGVYFTDFLIQQ